MVAQQIGFHLDLGGSSPNSMVIMGKNSLPPPNIIYNVIEPSL